MNPNHFAVIMSGGAGTRFWPFSRENKPKQFLDLFGTGRTLIQSTYDRLSQFIPKDHIYIITNEHYRDITLEQLPEANPECIVGEPMRKNTAPCIAYISYLIREVNPNASIIVAASDHLILNEQQYQESCLTALKFVNNDDHLVTLGIRPTKPETGYGYIQQGKGHEAPFLNVKTFTEKPNLEMAEIFFQSGEFLWNSGMFVWNVNSIIAAFEQHLPEVAEQFQNNRTLLPQHLTNGELIQRIYEFCPKISIDYAIMEKAENVLVLPASFGWADLGTWGSLYELSDNKDNNGNVSAESNVLFYESHNNIVKLQNQDQVAIIHGLDDMIVAQNGNALLICQKSEEQRIKSFLLDASVEHSDKPIR